MTVKEKVESIFPRLCCKSTSKDKEYLSFWKLDRTSKKNVLKSAFKASKLVRKRVSFEKIDHRMQLVPSRCHVRIINVAVSLLNRIIHNFIIHSSTYGQ